MRIEMATNWIGEFIYNAAEPSAVVDSVKLFRHIESRVTIIHYIIMQSYIHNHASGIDTLLYAMVDQLVLRYGCDVKLYKAMLMVTC